MHKMLQTLSWLQGIWVTDGVANGSYPNIKPFTYYDEINITSIGQPMFNYIAQSWHPETGEPMHRDTGFLQILPESNMIVLSLIDNLGLFTVEQGKLSDDNKSFDISSSNVLTTAASISPFSSLIQTRRVYKLDGDHLKLTFYMSTTNRTKLTEHLHARYKKAT